MVERLPVQRQSDSTSFFFLEEGAHETVSFLHGFQINTYNCLSL